MDPQCERRTTTAPARTKTLRNIVLRLAARLGTGARSADVAGALAQNEEARRDNMWAKPAPEFPRAVGILEGLRRS